MKWILARLRSVTAGHNGEDALPMIDVGDLRRFGFRIGPRGEFPDVREVSIFINCAEVSRYDRSAYVPSESLHLAYR